MTELARGTVADRPWGKTLAALGLRGLTGQLTVHADGGKRYMVVFDRGAVIGAWSPLATDAAARIAMTGGLISSTQVAEIVRRQTASPDRDEIDVIAELGKLSFEQAQRLRRRVVAHRAARTFSIDRGEFVVDDEISIAVAPGAELDIRAVIYLGARGNLSEQRLNVELGQLGVWFKIKPEAVEDLPQFGLGEAEQAVIGVLLDGATLHAIETVNPSVEQRLIRALVYSLVTCGACEAEARARPIPSAPMDAPTLRKPGVAARVVPGDAPRARPPTIAPRAATPAAVPPTLGEDPPTLMRGATIAPPLEDPPTQRATQRKTIAPPPGVAPVAAAPAPIMPTSASAAMRAKAPRTRVPTVPPRATPLPGRPQQTAEQVLAVITERLAALERGVDHFALLGVDIDATPDAVRVGYFALARQLHPDRLSALGIDDGGRQAQRLFAQVNTAFATLSDPVRRHEYADVMRRGGAAAVQAEQAQAEQMAMRVLDAEEAFRRGEMALRRDNHTAAIAEFQAAIALNPDEPDYHALLAWAQFCGSPDKMAAAAATRAILERGIAQAPKAVEPRFYLGRVERMLGRDQEALRHFKDVLKLSSGHAEASTEVRVIEARLQSAADDKDKPKGGLFGRLKR